MSFRQKLLLWGCLSLVGCIFSYISIQHYLRQQSALWEQQHAEPTAEFLVLTAALAEGEPIKTALLAVRSFPERLAQASWLTASDIDQVLNTQLKVAVEAGEPLKQHYFMVTPEISPLRQSLGAGERAITTRISMEQTLAGMMKPGDFIDIVVVSAQGASAFGVADGHNDQLERLAGIQVLAVDQQLVNAESPGFAEQAGSYDDGLESYAETITLRFTHAQALQFELMRQQNFSVWLHGVAPSSSAPQKVLPRGPRLHQLGDD